MCEFCRQSQQKSKRISFQLRTAHRQRAIRAREEGVGASRRIVLFDLMILKKYHLVRNIILSEYFLSFQPYKNVVMAEVSVTHMLLKRSLESVLRHWMAELVGEVSPTIKITYKIQYKSRRPVPPNLYGILLYFRGFRDRWRQMDRESAQAITAGSFQTLVGVGP